MAFKFTHSPSPNPQSPLLMSVASRKHRYNNNNNNNNNNVGSSCFVGLFRKLVCISSMGIAVEFNESEQIDAASNMVGSIIIKSDDHEPSIVARLMGLDSLLQDQLGTCDHQVISKSDKRCTKRSRSVNESSSDNKKHEQEEFVTGFGRHRRTKTCDENTPTFSEVVDDDDNEFIVLSFETDHINQEELRNDDVEKVMYPIHDHIHVGNTGMTILEKREKITIPCDNKSLWVTRANEDCIDLNWTNNKDSLTEECSLITTSEEKNEDFLGSPISVLDSRFQDYDFHKPADENIIHKSYKKQKQRKMRWRSRRWQLMTTTTTNWRGICRIDDDLEKYWGNYCRIDVGIDVFVRIFDELLQELVEDLQGLIL